MSNGHWLDALATLGAAGVPAVVVNVVGTRGSAPRRAGTHMVVTADALHGTIGGGHLEFQAIGIARDMLAGTRHAERLRRFALGASLGQCCGGVVHLLFEPVAADSGWVARAARLRAARTPFAMLVSTQGDAASGRVLVTAEAIEGVPPSDDAIAMARALLQSGDDARLTPTASGAPAWYVDPVRDDAFDVMLFGAGHVGRALVKLLADLPCRVTWVDARADAFPVATPPNVDVVVSDVPEDDVETARAGTLFLVMTHDHALDQRLAERILRRDDFAYFGLIGSASKRRQFEQRMARRGIPAERFASMTCPIGVPGIVGKEPAVIALAVAAQMLQVRAAASAVAGVERDARWA